ncbi:MAG: Lrp/AsnC family transcriptional regulator [Candidatus Altiarchaeota archaeon]|nr:Lrp/AsnC family transcriptional regulator [Candidatus Altiarchaeota archaeon]
MDDKDKKIIIALKKEGRARLSKISREIELPPTTTFNRIKKLEKEKIIFPTIKLDTKKLGYGVEFFSLISLDTAKGDVDQEVIAKQLVKIPGILGAWIVTGSVDIIARIVVKDIDELSNIILKKLREIKGVTSTETLVVMKKEEGNEIKLLG